MKKILLIVLLLLALPPLWGQTPAPAPPASPPAPDEASKLQQQVDELKKMVVELQRRLTAQEQNSQKPPATDQEQSKDTVSVTDLQTEVKDSTERLNAVERKTNSDRLQWGGDYRFQAHTIRGTVPAHFDGMQLQNLIVKTMFYMQTNNGMPPANVKAIENNVAANYSAYQYFTGKLTFNDLKAAMAQFPPQMQQQLFGMLMPSTFVASYNANNDALFTNRLRLKFDSQVADNITIGARLSMYKVFGDSTGVQVFNGQPNSISLDGTTARVPTGDMVRVERVYFNWNNIGGSKFYLSIGRRPSTDGPPMSFREDEPRGGTPSGTLFDYQYDGATFGYHLNDKMTFRICYGMGYSAGFGNGNLLKSPADRVKDVHLAGGVLDLYESDKTFVQALLARAWNVTDGFNGQIVLPNNPVTGEPIGAPVIMRFTPSTNLGNIDLYGLVLQHRMGPWEGYVSANWVSLRPNGQTTPFGGLGSDPFETPTNHDGQMVLAGLRFNVPKNDGRTKIGFEFNHGSKYWFNFAQAEDDILMPKTSTRGEVYEAYLTHRISDHFILKGDFMRYNYTWSGSGWHLGTPKKLDSTPILGFPTYDDASVFSLGLIARF
jgi:hypothetical protein